MGLQAKKPMIARLQLFNRFIKKVLAVGLRLDFFGISDFRETLRHPDE